MKLTDLIQNLNNYSNDQVIYASSVKPWTGSTNVKTGLISDLVDNNYTPPNMEYFLEVSYAKEVLEVWANWRNGKLPNISEKIQAILYYVEHDAYIPFE